MFLHNGPAGGKIMLRPKKGEKLHDVHFNQRRPKTPSALRNSTSDSSPGEPRAHMICGPVRQGRFIAHLRIQLSVATLIIDAAPFDFEVEEKGSSCSKTEGF